MPPFRGPCDLQVSTVQVQGVRQERFKAKLSVASDAPARVVEKACRAWPTDPFFHQTLKLLALPPP